MHVRGSLSYATTTTRTSAENVISPSCNYFSVSRIFHWHAECLHSILKLSFKYKSLILWRRNEKCQKTVAEYRYSRREGQVFLIPSR